METFLPYRLVASFADGNRLLFDGITEELAIAAMAAAQEAHGDITWYDGVTDEHYEHGVFCALVPPPEELTIIDLTNNP